ncbi:MAG: hypothetical protein K2R98_03240 [Gemmataceae bacterium]|nr:hypothetical protein [Gemmataceae bacterium]
MSFMFEVYYAPPADPTKEAWLTDLVARLGGRFDFREEPVATTPGGVCLTYEFDSWDTATTAAVTLRERGEHVEGPQDYGP